ncbi:STAS domain-containing protein [Streptacidiphilus sp. PAMC 29251]
MSLTQQAPAVAPHAQRAVQHHVVQGLGIRRRDRRFGTTLTLAGELDLATAPLLDLAVRQCLGAAHRTIDLDLANLTFCDVAGLHALLDANWLTAAAAGRLRLENLCPVLVRLLTRTGTWPLLTTVVDDSINGLLLPGAQRSG